MTENSKSSPPYIEFKNVSLHFGAIRANEKISFVVERGKIHAFVGENGAGKSTAMKILFGLYQRDEGDILINGKSVNFTSPQDANRCGIGMVHQHFTLAGAMTALDHVLLEDKAPSFWSLFMPLARKKRTTELEKLSEKFKMPIDWHKLTNDLSVGFQQRLEILKLLSHDVETLIFDEPTAVLTPLETEAFYQKILELKAAGKTVLLVTHKLKDVLKYSDEITVFRKGEVIKSLKSSLASLDLLSELMIGQILNDDSATSVNSNKFDARGSQLEKVPEKKLVPEITLNKISVPELKLRKVDFTISSGEILGIAGIEGNGQSELIKFLLNPGKYPSAQGQYYFQNQEVVHENTMELRKKGYRYLPQDRLRQGSVLELNLVENFLLGSTDSRFWIDTKSLKFRMTESIKSFDIRPNNLETIFSKLSGGNQQKLVVARELQEGLQFLIAAEPTRGVDIGAVATIHHEILKLKNQGLPILLISSDLDELMNLSDRIVVIRDGETKSIWKKEHFNEFEIGREMLGGDMISNYKSTAERSKDL